MTEIQVIDAPKQMTKVKAQKLSDRIHDQCVKVDAEQGVLRGHLLKFYDGKGFAALGHKRWEDWAVEVMPGHRSSLFRQLSAGQHERALQLEIGSTPESHLRDLSKVPADKRQEVMDNATLIADAAGRERQASDVKAAVAEAKGPAKAGDKLKDSVGVVVPSKLRAVFEEAKAPFDEALRMLQQLSTLVGEIATGKAKDHVSAQLDAIEQNRAAMYGAIKFCRPFAVSADGKSWLNESSWNKTDAGVAAAKAAAEAPADKPAKAKAKAKGGKAAAKK